MFVTHKQDVNTHQLRYLCIPQLLLKTEKIY